MTDYYIGEIRLWACPRIPVDFHVCDGTLLPIQQYQALFSLLGTRFGGDGVNTFGLPDLRGRLPVGEGQLTGGGNYVLAQSGGTNAVVLNAAQMPAHTHSLVATTQAANQMNPGGNMLADPDDQFNLYIPYNASNSTIALAPAIQPTGGSQGHENRMPSMALNYIIALNGLYPSQF